MKKYLVHTISTFRHTYVVEADNHEKAQELVLDNLCTGEETDQQFISEEMLFSHSVTKKQYKEFVEQASNGFAVDKLIIREQ